MTPDGIADRLISRYGRTRDGKLGHHGDCWIYACRICTCGLLHDLVIQPPESQALYPSFAAEDAAHQAGLQLVQEDRLGVPRFVDPQENPPNPQTVEDLAAWDKAHGFVKPLDWMLPTLPDITKDTP